MRKGPLGREKAAREDFIISSVLLRPQRAITTQNGVRTVETLIYDIQATLKVANCSLTLKLYMT